MSGFRRIFNKPNSVINSLRLANCSGYILSVAAKSATGRGNPSNLTATPDAPCVFFVSVPLRTCYLYSGVNAAVALV